MYQSIIRFLINFNVLTGFVLTQKEATKTYEEISNQIMTIVLAPSKNTISIRSFYNNRVLE